MGGYNTNTANREEKAILIGLIHTAQNEKQVKEYLDELEFLAYTAIAKTVKRFVQRRNRRAQSKSAKTHTSRGRGRSKRERSEERRVGKECRSRWSPYH